MSLESASLATTPTQGGSTPGDPSQELSGQSTPAQNSSGQATASGSSFYAGMRVLPKPQRDAMYAVYGFCRAVDDIADDLDGSAEDRRAALETWRRDIDALYTGGPPQPSAGHAVFLAGFLAEPIRRFGLDRSDFHAVIDGMEMDVDGPIRAPGRAELELYCDRVASAVGRLSVRIFGMQTEPGLALAHHLGRALQLTNILRDLDEDAGIGRLYMPRELLDAAGIAADDPWAAVEDPRIDDAARALAAQAQAHYEAAAKILDARPAGRMAAPRLMYAVYSRILARMQAQGWAPPRSRVSLGRLERLWVVIRHGLLG